ncbi:MAG: Asd/ArgC dimerization domain-containing protein [Granulosicoccaceae bacterium]|jgi:aspartate-semialdehyde dehydrogenase
MAEEGISLAIAGASSDFGRALTGGLSSLALPLSVLHLLDPRDTASGRIEYDGHYHTVAAIEDFDFAGTDLVICATGPELARQHIPRARQAGSLVIDLSGASSLEPGVPLIVAGVNDDMLAGLGRGDLVASPDPFTVQLCHLLKPLSDAGFGLQRVDSMACRAVSMLGKSGSDTLAYETVQLLNMRQPERFGLGRQIAFNLLPAGMDVAEHIGAETRKVLDKQELEINLRVIDSPVFHGNSLQCFIDFAQACELARCRQVWADSPAIELYEAGPPSAVTEATGNTHIVLGGLEPRDGERPGISIWSVADGLLAGVAGNALAIAGILVKSVL